MKKTVSCLLAVVCLLAGVQGALAVAYSFPFAGIRLDAQADWTVLTPDTIEGAADMLAGLGVDGEVLAADYSAGHVVFEVFMPDGIQVSLRAVDTEQTRTWVATTQMTEADKDFFFASLDNSPYEHAAWSQKLPGYVRNDWTMEAGGLPVSFAGLSTVRQGLLYQLVASGAGVEVESLHTANEAVLAGLVFLGGSVEASEDAAILSMPETVEDDGAVTPLEFVDFSTVTYEDTTELNIRTLPNAEVLLQTATDTLRGRANEAGQHTFRVSTRRETVYEYTVTAQAEGRTASAVAVAVDRQLTPEAQEEVFRKSAKPIETYGYESLANAPENYGGTAISLRGSVGGFTELGGFPCVLLYTVNPGRGVWQNPVWVMLTEPIELAEEDICTVYGEVRGDVFAYTDAEGNVGEAPVVVSRSITK